jgi:serine-type D-Ala-D-Ala carboxypeptidase (penicillin-binding protein 5/6)
MPRAPLLAFFSALVALCGAAAADTLPAPAIAARSWLLMDVSSGQPIASRNADERIEPASLTKLMTAYVAFSALRQKAMALTQTVPVSVRAWRAGGSRMFIQPSKPVTVEELLYGVIVDSGNDACIALAEAVAGSEEAFVQLMNREAQRLDMSNTSFTNASGLPDPKHYSTASDLAVLTAALIRDFPEYYKFYSVKQYRYNNISQHNRNRLLWLDPNVDGVKTGHTESAGYCLIASARRGPRRLLSVVLGAASDGVRAQDSQKLLNYGFQSYDSVRVYQKEHAISTLEVWKGSASRVRAGVSRDLFVTVPKGESGKLKADLLSQQPLVAPVAAGQRIGTLRVTLDGEPLADFPVVALEPVAIAGWFGRAWDGFRLWFK